MKLKIDNQTREINCFTYSNLYVNYLKYSYYGKINLNWLNEITIFRR